MPTFHEGQDVEVYRRIVPISDRDKEPPPHFWAWRRARIVEMPDYEGQVDEHHRCFLVKYVCGGIHACGAWNMRPLPPIGGGQ